MKAVDHSSLDLILDNKTSAKLSAQLNSNM